MRALVVGASGSLGQSITKRLVKEGYEVVGTVRPDKIKKLETELEHCHIIPLDMDNKTSIDTFLKKIDTSAPFDLFTSTVANVLTFAKFEQTPLDVFEDDLRINVANHIKILKGIIPHFNEGGLVVFILSELVTIEEPKYLAPYIISKYALLGLMRTLAAELKPKIRVNAISPGMMDTPFIKELPSFMKQRYDQESGFVKPENVAAEIIKLTKDQSIIGANILVSG